MSDLQIKSLIHTRKYLRADITRNHNKINEGPDSIPFEELEFTLMRLSDMRSRIKDMNAAVMQELVGAGDEVATQQEYNLSEEYSNKLMQGISILKSRLANPGISVQTHDHEAHNRDSPAAFLPNKLKLPQIPMPTYGHKDGEDLHKFFLTFENIIAKYHLSDYEKFIFLQGQINGEPLTLIKSLDVGSQTYNTAKELLTRAFASPVTQQFETIKRMCELKFSAKYPYEFVGKLRQIRESFKSLKITPEILMQYFFWNSMPELLQNQFINISNSNKPNLGDIEKHIFDAMERFLDSVKKQPVKNEDFDVSNYAVSMNAYKSDKSSKQFCSLCSTASFKVNNHSTYNCQKYLSTFDKLNRLKSINGCLRCANVTHDSSNCKFVFKRTCLNCSKPHFTFLCPDNIESKENDRAAATKYGNANNGPNHSRSNNKRHEKSGKSGKKEVNASCMWVNETTFDNAGQDAILPTFTCTINGMKIRAMRDSGCQSSFITQTLADQLRLKVIKPEFELGIHGFNSSKRIATTVVELSVTADQPPISLICVPEIRTSLHLPGLNDVVEAFVDRGYVLADKMLLGGGDEIDHIDIVIGDNEAQIIPQSDVTFGDEHLSMFANTPFGVMLFGGIERMMQNISHLPHMRHDAEQVANGSIFPSVTTMHCSGSVESKCTVSANFSQTFEVLDSSGKVDHAILEQAVESALKEQIDHVLSYDKTTYEENVVESDKALVNHVIQNTTRAPDGRLRMPLMWNSSVAHRLANNFTLSKAILKSNVAKLQKTPEKLLMYNQVIKDQESLGVIEKVEDIQNHIKTHPTCSFLAHMGIFKLKNDTTKCRIVYLSNLCDRKYNKNAISHNQAIMSGPCLNKKITTAVCEMRFGKYLLCFDIIKAFLNIELYPHDQEKLMFLWYRNVAKKDFSLVAYKCVRLCFGIRCAPTILLISLYIILIIDADKDGDALRNLKRLVYSLIYMDNGAVTADNIAELNWAHEKLTTIFEPYKFFLQQFCTNNVALQSAIDADGEETPSSVKLLGMQWERENDTISTQPLQLNLEAKTKRQVLSSIASNYDTFQLNGPLLNRARMFMHALQCENSLSWDEVLDATKLKEWANICRQLNNTPVIRIQRCIGRRDGLYNLITCTDSSKTMYGAVLYIQDCADGKISFLAAKSKIVNEQLKTKTIPSLEFHAIALGVELMFDYLHEIGGEKTMTPIKISKLFLLSDSMVSLSWLYSACHKIDKMQKVAAFVKNRLTKICALCEEKPVEFSHVPGSKNSADCLTRCLSYKQLMQTNYFTGPDMNNTDNDFAGMKFEIPAAEHVDVNINVAVARAPEYTGIDPTRFANFNKLFRAQKYVFLFINELKRKSNEKRSKKFHVSDESELNSKTWDALIKADQEANYHDVTEFFRVVKLTPNKSVPPIVTQLNVYMDTCGILRVQSKFDRWSDHKKYTNPILLSKTSPLTVLIIADIHRRKGHTGCYNVLNELRRTFFLPHHFSVVKKVLRKCVHCRRVNSRTIRTTQNKYRDFRVSPPNIPYRYIFLDHFGPYWVKLGGTRSKVWVLCICCLWSRAINLKLCTDLSTSEFLKAFQTHIFEFGAAELVASDLGSQLVAGGNVISALLNDPAVNDYLQENQMKTMTFTQYSKGCHDLGGIVESCVKLSKRMISGCIGKQVLDVFDFMFTLSQAVCLINKRPIAFREALRDDGRSGDLPTPITPEVLLRGHDLVTLCILPYQPVDVDPDWTPDSNGNAHIKSSFKVLNENRQKLTNIYQEEFLSDLTRQATNVPNRYTKIKHDKLEVGDVVLLKEPNIKSVNFPMGRVLEIVTNSLGEVTDTVLIKGNREKVRRSVKSLILLLKCGTTAKNADVLPTCATNDLGTPVTGTQTGGRPKRTSAVRCNNRMADMARQNLI